MTEASSETGLETRGSPKMGGQHLDSNPGWSIGMEAYAGLGVLSFAEGTRGHALIGGVSRVRIGYVEFGGALEASDYELERWRQLGAFVGTFLPFTNWVDVDASVGLAYRDYVSTDTRYGAGGLQVGLPALTLRVGFSDRLAPGMFGARLGGAFLVGIDLARQEANWTYEVAHTQTIVGQSRFGGVTFGLVMTAGFDFSFRSRNPRQDNMERTPYLSVP